MVRRDRVIYDRVFKKLEQDLEQKEQELVGYIRGSIEVDKEKDLILEQLKNIKQTLQDEKSQVLQGISQLYRL